MKVYLRPKQSGKTEIAIRASHDKWAYIICPKRYDCERIYKMAKEMNIDIPYPISWLDFVEKRYRGKGIKDFVIDDLDRCIQESIAEHIHLVTFNQSED